MINTTLCYIEKDGCRLMLHRSKKKNDYNHDKWIGIGGKFENAESPRDCAVREVFEETGLIVQPADLEYCGVVTFVDTTLEEPYTEFMHIFRTARFTGTLNASCDEGELEWVPIDRMNDLPHWEGDEIFLELIAQNHPFFELKLIYKNNNLLKAFLDGKLYHKS